MCRFLNLHRYSIYFALLSLFSELIVPLLNIESPRLFRMFVLPESCTSKSHALVRFSSFLSYTILLRYGTKSEVVCKQETATLVAMRKKRISRDSHIATRNSKLSRHCLSPVSKSYREEWMFAASSEKIENSREECTEAKGISF
jgi:hypothetical protein